LLTAVTLPEMVGQVCRAIEWVASNLSENVFLCGHSSSAHLAACALTRVPSVKAALLVSGMYDLLPVRLSARNVYVRLDERLEHEYSPIRHTDRIRCPVTVAWAEKESAEFARQSREFAEKLQVPARRQRHEPLRDHRDAGRCALAAREDSAGDDRVAVFS